MTKTEMLMNRSTGAGRMKRDIIYRQDAIDALDCINGTEEVLRSLPSAQPERKTGEWVVTSEFEDCRYAKCNQCKVTQVFYYNKPLTNFCPYCGADMREGQDG